MKNYPLYEHPNFTDLRQLVTMQAGRIPDHIAFQYLKQGKIENFQQNKIDENSACSVIFTSGTTGTSKEVMLSQKNLVTDAVGGCRNVYFAGPSLLTLPLHHTFAFTAGILTMLVYGVPVCISKGLPTFKADMQIFRPHHMFLVPLYVETMYKNIWKSAQEQGKAKLLKALIAISRLARKCGLDFRKNCSILSWNNLAVNWT